MEWPLLSPDLNPIEAIWNWIKDYIEDKYGLEEKTQKDKLKKARIRGVGCCT
jgi:transposase